MATDKEPPIGEDPPKGWFDRILGPVKALKTASTDKFEEMVERFNSMVPLIEQAGFVVSEIEVLMSVPPSLRVHVMPGDLLTGEERDAFFARIADHKMSTRVIKSLFRAKEIGGDISFAGFGFYEIELEVGIIPSVNVKFLPKSKLPIVPATI